MRRVLREALDPDVDRKLQQRQTKADRDRSKGVLNAEVEWNNARRTKVLRAVLATLKKMAGRHERCMYCVDSHGTDIDHFRPKAQYPEKLFVWLNMLLSCTECGRMKGSKFPLSNGQPLVVDPTAEDPWQYLDFDPKTGNLVARFDRAADDWSPRGESTVELLQLDRREALAQGYLRTFSRLSTLVRRHLSENEPDAAALPTALTAADDHGLLGWCITGVGQDEEPFRNLRQQYPELWTACVSATQSPYT